MARSGLSGLRWALPIGLILLVGGLVFYGYGFATGEFEARPHSVLTVILSLGTAASVVWLGWTARRET